MKHLFRFLVFSTVFAAPIAVFAQSTMVSEAPSEEEATLEGQSDYRSPAFMSEEELAPKNLPVNGTSAYTFNPATGLYEHTASQKQAEQDDAVMPGEGGRKPNPDVQYRGSEAKVDDVDPYARAGGYRGGEENSRGIRNTQRDNNTRRANANAYREMMGEAPEEDTSVDDYETDRSYLRNSSSRRYNSGRYAEEPRGIYSNRVGSRYSDEDDGYYEDEEMYDRYGKRVSGYGRDGRSSRRISNEPKTGNRDAYREMMSQIEGGGSDDAQ